MGPFKQIRLSTTETISLRRVVRKLTAYSSLLADMMFVPRAKRREYRRALDLHRHVTAKLHELTRQHGATSWSRQIDEDFVVSVRFTRGYYQEDTFIVTLTSSVMRVIDWQNMYQYTVREYTFSTLFSDVERVIKYGRLQSGKANTHRWSKVVPEDMTVDQVYFDLIVIDSLLEEDQSHVEA